MAVGLSELPAAKDKGGRNKNKKEKRKEFIEGSRGYGK